MNSPTKPFKPGRPIEANDVNRNIAAYLGIDILTPPKSLIFRVCLLSYINPTSINKAPAVIP